jgi:hypothetical protein
LRDSVKDPINQGSITYTKLREARQQEGQFIQSFIIYIEDLKKDITLISPIY